MDMPTVDVDLGPEKIEDEKEGGPLVHCDLCDTEVVHKLAQMFLPGLASACVDNTSGDLFKTPGSVAVDLRKELIDYLTQRSESFVAESIILEGGPDVGCRSAVATIAETIGENDDKEDSDTNKNGSEQSTEASDVVNSSDKAEVSDIATHGAENTAKNEDSEHSSIENKGSEEKTETSNIAKLPDEAEIGHVKEDSAPINNENKDVTASELKIKGNEVNLRQIWKTRAVKRRQRLQISQSYLMRLKLGHVKEDSAPFTMRTKM
ncbi:TNF receptor-associated factor family protein [Sesbania bispinosa]|nr:TNF receptor-associated factor family protein [Sesbania bispinosa]